MHHNIEEDDRNRVIHHNHSDETLEKIAVILKDAATRELLEMAAMENTQPLIGSLYITFLNLLA